MTLDTRQAEALSDGELWETINRTQDQLESGDYAGAGRSVATITDSLALEEPENQESLWASLYVRVRYRNKVLDSAGAIDDGRRALSIARRIRNQLQITLSMSVLATALDHDEQYGEAQSMFRATLERRLVARGPDSLEYAVELTHLGVSLERSGKCEEATEVMLRALGILRADIPERLSGRSIALHSLANCAQRGGRLVEARSLYQRSLRALEVLRQNDTPHAATVLYNLALLSLEAGDRSVARRHAGEALRIRRRELPRSDPRLIDTEELVRELGDGPL